MRNTSLDEFLNAGSENEESADDAAGEADETADAGGGGAEGAPGSVEETESTGDETPESEDTAPMPEDVEPARATFDFAPDGVTCEGCDATVQRRWRDGDAMVCAECKEW